MIGMICPILFACIPGAVVRDIDFALALIH